MDSFNYNGPAELFPTRGGSRDLKTAGCKKLFREQVSSTADRDQLEATVDYIREGDNA
jgi:hypothetical protein